MDIKQNALEKVTPASKLWRCHNIYLDLPEWLFLVYFQSNFRFDGIFLEVSLVFFVSQDFVV